MLRLIVFVDFFPLFSVLDAVDVLASLISSKLRIAFGAVSQCAADGLGVVIGAVLGGSVHCTFLVSFLAVADVTDLVDAVVISIASSDVVL